MSALHPENLQTSADITPGLLLARLGQGAMELYRDALKDSGLRPPHVVALTLLRTGPVGQQVLGERSGLDPVKLVGILNDLETAGLLERRRDCMDRRRHNVALTSAGRAQLAAVERAAARVDEQLLSGLTPDQRSQLAALLRLVDASAAVANPCTRDQSDTDARAGDRGAA